MVRGRIAAGFCFRPILSRNALQPATLSYDMFPLSIGPNRPRRIGAAPQKKE